MKRLFRFALFRELMSSCAKQKRFTMADVYATAREMLADLGKKKISARELLDLHVARNSALHEKLNAVIQTDLDHARAAAKSIDDARAHKAELGALAGLPMTIKDGLDVYGMPASAGAREFQNRDKNCNDADVVAAARKQEAVIWGKTNVPYMLGDIQTYNDIYGTTNNPYDVTRTCGGSSGGAATALAAGITPLEIGSDIGGSLRHPANFCGVVSLKPTWGALPLRGHIPPAPDRFLETDLGVVGPMARNAGDARLLWHVLSGRPETRASVRDLRIAVWDEEPGWPLASEVRAVVEHTATVLARLGAKMVRAKPAIPGDELLESYRTLLTGVLNADLPEEIYNAFLARRENDRKIVAAGGDKAEAALYRLRATGSYREIVQAQIQREKQKAVLAKFFDDTADAILMPISPVTAFPHMHAGTFSDRKLDVDGTKAPYSTLLWWIALATSLHAPALAMQGGRTASGMPVGVQLVGPWNAEDRLFDIGGALEQASGGFEAPAL
jgi:amidase